jgi:hypothetical protein
MMDFIMVPLIVGSITLGIYKLFELFARRKERLLLIEKMGDKITPQLMDNPFGSVLKIQNKLSFGALKIGLLLIGVGLGLLVGFYISGSNIPMNMKDVDPYWFNQRESVVYGASVLLFGGIGLLVAFLLELRLSKKDSK